MNIFDGFMNMGGRPGGGIPGYGTGVAGAPSTGPGLPDIPEQPYSGGYGDMSGFASYAIEDPGIPSAMKTLSDLASVAGQQERGMPNIADSFNMMPRTQTPQIPDAFQRIAGIMSLMDDPHRGRKEDPIMQNQPGGLMAYMNALSEV